MRESIKEQLERAAKFLRNADRLCAFTGAGISQESGIPTFRGEGGLWRTFRPEELATPEAFLRNPELVWQFYRARRSIVSEARPNAAHQTLAAWERRFKSVPIVTQNVDGLHKRAGSTNVIELHGSLWNAKCNRCSYWVSEAALAEEGLPSCKVCGSWLRPAVVFFGELLDEKDIEMALEAIAAADVILIVGTSGLVEPAAGFVRNGRSDDAQVIEINTERSGLTEIADVSLFGTAAEMFRALDGLL